jgi:hypothetical protein
MSSTRCYALCVSYPAHYLHPRCTNLSAPRATRGNAAVQPRPLFSLSSACYTPVRSPCHVPHHPSRPPCAPLLSLLSTFAFPFPSLHLLQCLTHIQGLRSVPRPQSRHTHSLFTLTTNQLTQLHTPKERPLLVQSTRVEDIITPRRHRGAGARSGRWPVGAPLLGRSQRPVGGHKDQICRVSSSPPHA